MGSDKAKIEQVVAQTVRQTADIFIAEHKKNAQAATLWFKITGIVGGFCFALVAFVFNDLHSTFKQQLNEQNKLKNEQIKLQNEIKHINLRIRGLENKIYK